MAGAVSTSGPLLAKADFYEYLEVVSASLDTVSRTLFILTAEYH